MNTKASYTKIEQGSKQQQQQQQRRSSSGEIIFNNPQASSAVRRRSSVTVTVAAAAAATTVLRSVVTVVPPAAYEPISLQPTDDDNNNNNSSSSSNNNNNCKINDTDFCIDDNDEFYPPPSSNSNNNLNSIDTDYSDDDVNNNTSTTIKSKTSCWDYVKVLRKYPAYRVYLLSHMCQNLGDWFVRIASILIVEELAAAASSTSTSDNSNGTGKALSYVTLARLLPNAMFVQLGGILADRLDRRHIMISIDILSGIVVLGYLIAIQYKSLTMFYVVTSLRSALSATYYPATTGIVPLLVHGDPHDLQMAVTMNSWAWGLCAIIGGLFAGSLASVIGLQACYLIDLITYWISATVIAIYIKGNFKVAGDTTTTTTTTNSNSNSNNNKNIDDQKENNLSTMAAIAVGGGYQPTSSTTDDETIIIDDCLSSIDENDNNNNNNNNNSIGSHNHNHNPNNNDNNSNSNPIKKVYGEMRDLFTYLSTCGFGMMIFLKSSARYVTIVVHTILVQSFFQFLPYYVALFLPLLLRSCFLFRRNRYKTFLHTVYSHYYHTILSSSSSSSSSSSTISTILQIK
jgi:MFS family permease